MPGTPVCEHYLHNDQGRRTRPLAHFNPAPRTAALTPAWQLVGVGVAGVHDEDTAIDEVITRIDRARTGVWCWSAWAGRHADGIIDALCRAHQR
jgi:hypothetical protein